MAGRTKGWSYRTGEKGINRVRAYEHPTNGKLYLEFYEHGKRLAQPTATPNRAEAKAMADKLAAALRDQPRLADRSVSLQSLFDIYVREVSPKKSQGKMEHDRRTAKLLVSILGGRRLAESLTHRDAARFLDERRRQGDQRPGKRFGGALGTRQLQYDLSFVRAVFNWAVGAQLLDRNPWAGFKYSVGKQTTNRPLLKPAQYDALLAIADEVGPGFALALVLAWETGHRIGAIRQLRWSDIDCERRVIHWRPKNDKTGFGHIAPTSEAAHRALLAERKRLPGIGDCWLFPAPKNPEKCVDRHLADAWWDRAERLAELEPHPGRGWHSCRRTFATELKGVPIPDLCALGGWRDAQTILRCYQQPDPQTMRRALEARQRLQA